MRYHSIFIVAALLAGCGDGNEPDAQSTAKSKANAARPNATTAKAPGQDDLARSTAALLDAAQTHLQNRNIRSAVEVLNNAIQNNPKFAEAYLRRGEVLAGLGANQEALADLDQAVALAPQNAGYYAARGFFFLTRQIHDRAVTDFTKALEIDPRQAPTYNNRGLAFLSQREHDKAIADFNAAIQLNPKHAGAFNNRGLAHLSTDEKEKALADFSESLRLNPERTNSYENRGILHFKAGEHQKAVADFSEAIGRDRNNPKYYSLRREAYRELGNRKAAAADADKVSWLTKLKKLNYALHQTPKDLSSHVERAEHLAMGGESKFALASYETAIELDPNFAKTYTSRAAYWFGQGEFDKAIADCTKSLEVCRRLMLDPLYKAHSIRGDAYLKKGEFDKAIADYAVAKRFDVTVARAHLLRSKHRRQQGDAPGADRDLQTAIKLDPTLKESP